MAWNAFRRSIVQRFSPPNLSLIFNVFEKRDRVLLGVMIVVSLSLGFLDLFGVILIGVIGSLSVTGISSGNVGDRVSNVLRILGLDEFQFEVQVVIISITATLALILKSLLSMYLFKKSLFFMAKRAAKLSTNLIQRFLSSSVEFQKRQAFQKVIYALTDGVNALMVNTIGLSITLVSDIVLLVLLFSGLMVVDAITALASISFFGLVAMFLHRNMAMKAQQLGEQQGKLNIESSKKIFEAMHSHRELFVGNRIGRYSQELGTLRFNLAEGFAEIGFLNIVSKYTMEISLVLSSFFLAVYQFQVSSAPRAIATIGVFIAASTRILPAIIRIQQGLVTMKSGLAQAEPTLNLLTTLGPNKLEKYEPVHLIRNHGNFQGTVEVSNLEFKYDNANEVFGAFNFRINKGEFVAFVGASGAGKSTLMDLILGVLEPSVGRVLISDLDPREVFTRWPGAIAYVPQETNLINGSIRENLGLGFPIEEITDEICWEVLSATKLDEFVNALPHRLDSYIGDRGSKLSGGQRQRLGIARALVTRPRILFLDESTSALDSLTESVVTNELKGMIGDLTLVVIAHRLSTVVEADRIFMLEKGRIKGSGNFNELKGTLGDLSDYKFQLEP